MTVLRIVGETLSAFGNDTSIAGLNNAAKSKSTVRKAYWVVIFSVLFYFTASGIVSVVDDFLSYPVVTSINLDNKASVAFPAVTVCNHNRYGKQATRKYGPNVPYFHGTVKYRVFPNGLHKWRSLTLEYLPQVVR